METASVTNRIFTSSKDDSIVYETAEEHGSLNKDDFMKLFVTQLQYQDPMAPMESADMSQQVAQFNMVDLLYKSNDAMEELVSAQNTATYMSAVTMVGHRVRYHGNILEVGENGPEKFSLELDRPVSQCAVTIHDMEGGVVSRIDMGFVASGSQTLDWDGTDMNGNQVPPGFYRVSVNALDTEGNEVDVPTLTTGTVQGVSYDDKGLPVLSVLDGDEITIEDIRMVEG